MSDLFEGGNIFKDDAGTIFVNWDNGSKLGLIPGVDQWKIIHE